MIATAVENEENRPRCVMHQALQKLDKDRTVDSALGHHETQVAPRADGRDHIHRTPLPRAPHHRRLALNPPRRSRMTIRSHPGFVAKVDIRPDFPSLSANPRVLLLQPPPHSFRVLLEGPERSEEHTSELQSLAYLVCRLLLEKKKNHTNKYNVHNKKNIINNKTT